jgi:hypothetical protein
MLSLSKPLPMPSDEIVAIEASCTNYDRVVSYFAAKNKP